MIPAIQELNFPKIEGEQYATLTHATVTLADMGEKTISTQVKIDGDIVPDFSQDWELAFQGEKYIMPLRLPQGAKENTSLNSTIDLTFQHWAIYQLKRWPFVTIQPIDAGTYVADEEVASVKLNLKGFCDLFGQVLEYYYGDTITIDFNDDTDTGWEYDKAPTAIEISHSLIWNVLIDAFHDKYGVRWAIEPREDNDNAVKGGERYVIKIGYPTTEVDHIFEYGFEGGLLKLERQVQSEEIRNMIKGRGGEINIPFRYFKDTDPNNKDFAPDRDWVEELKNIYFPNLMPATYRSYVQGWKAAHISKYPGYTPIGENNAYSPWAYRKGFTDTNFHPVEFVADEITLNPQEGDRPVQIYPDYSPYIKKGSSIDVYGPLSATLDNNADIYPTIQGTGLDIAVDVEQIESDDIVGSAENAAEVVFFQPWDVTARDVAPGEIAVLSKKVGFSVDDGTFKNLFISPIVLEAYVPGEDVLRTFDAEVVSYSVLVKPTDSDESIEASGIPSGSYIAEISIEVKNLSKDKTLNITVGDEHSALMSATPESGWKQTWNIWVKNIWDTEKGLAEDASVILGETDEEYSERVWNPILGDRKKNAAKVVFTTGELVGEDYEFTIVDLPVPDISRSYIDASGVKHDSHWRIKLAKSDAELDATGLYVPSTQKQGKAGDMFAFIGTEMTHVPYVVNAEIRLDDWKKDHLGKVKEIKPTFVVTTDRVRLNNEGKPDALINQLRVGNSLRIADKRFIQQMGDRAYETLYLQSLTYTFREPSSEDSAHNPDVEIVLSNEYTTSANPVSVMQGEISSMQRLLGSISNVEQIVRAVCDGRYLRKDGISDYSLSPTRFYSLLASGDFRSGIIGGIGWGFYKDENGNVVCEADRFKARKDFEVNNLVVNQVLWRGGMIVESAAQMEVTDVIKLAEGYECYFDQKSGSVANLFEVGDVAYCNRFTAENQHLKFYKRRVVAVSDNSIILTKGYSGIDRPDDWADGGVNGDGEPSVGDLIIQYGSYTNPNRRYVKVRDVIGGGYERYIEDLDSVFANGREYYFAGRQMGLYGGVPRWFVGDENGYAKYENREFTIKARLLVESTIGDLPIDDYISGKIPLTEVGGANLLVNSDFADGFNGWAHTDGLVEIRPGANDGEPKTVQIISEGATSLTWAGITQGPTEYLLASPGENMIASLYAHGDPSSFDKDAWLEVWFYDSNKEPLSTLSSLGEKITPTDSLRRRVVYKFKTPEGTAYVGVKIYIKQNGRLFIDSLKVERGTVATDWSLSPVDEKTRLHSFDYLKAALKEDTIVGGGLVQTSMLLLGHTDPNSGLYKIMAGSSGLWDPDKGGRTIASWWGGSAVDLFDADGNLLAEPPADAAQAMVRMDGSGYLAGGAIHWGTDGKLHADPLSFFVGEEYVGLHLSLFQFFPGTVDAIGLVDYAIPQAPFSKLMIGTRSSHGLIEWDGENSCFRFNGSVCATGNIVGFNGDGPDGGGSGGGSSYGLMRQWPSTAPGADTTDALGANLGYELLTRLSAVETDYITGDTVELLLQELTDGIGAKFVQALEVRGDKLVWTKNDVDNALTIPYATSAGTAATLSSTRKIWGQSFKGDGNVSGRWELDGNTAGAFSIFRDATVAAINLQSYANMPLVINRAGNNVGIGNITSPAAKLHVGGSFRAGASVLDSLTVTGDGNFLHLASSTQRCQFSTGVDERVLLQVDGASLAGGVATWRCAIMRADIDGHIAFGAVYPLPDYRVYIPDNLRVDKGITVKSGEYIYLNESHTAWLRYNAASGCIETNVSFMSHQNIIGTKE